jgi:hypothetical protein
VLGLLLVTTWLYAPALDFGFIWDDPLWYGRAVGQSLGSLVSPMPDYHFYRPLLVLYNRLFLRPDNTFAIPLLHAAQVGWHLLYVALTYALSRRLGLQKWTAVAVAGLVALYPFSHQAVAWSAPGQTPAAALQGGAWLTFVVARQRRAGRRRVAGLSLLLFTMALFVMEGTAALAAVPLLLEWVLRRRGTSVARAGWQLALVYPAIAVGFGLLWLLIPRQAGYTALIFEKKVALYSLQGLVFPWLGRLDGYAPGQSLAPGVLLALTGLTLAALLAAAWRAGRLWPAVLGLAWALLGMAPSIVGLEFSYVRSSPRLFYFSSPGVALLWGCALLPPTNASTVRRWWRAGGTVLLILIALQSGLLLSGFQRLFTVGSVHLAELVQAAPDGDTRLLFVNFPDRYAPRRAPYPLGYWGMILAPVSVDLGAFPALATARRPHTLSHSMPWVDAEARDAGPYQINLRGTIVPPEQLYQIAHQMDAVYVSRYSSGGAFSLQWAGSVTATAGLPVDVASACRLAVFSHTLCLQDAQIAVQERRLDLTLTWLSLSEAQPHDTVFAHLGQAGQPPVAQTDGDAWLGMLPLSAWQPGDTVRERRVIPLPEAIPPGPHVIRIGVYNRLTGQRFPATTPQGEPLPGDALDIGHLP